MTDYRMPCTHPLALCGGKQASPGLFRIEDHTPPGVFLGVFHGPSMIPTLREGDVLEVEHYKERSIRRGDIVWAIPSAGQTAVIHRVRDIWPDGLRTRGDNCERSDLWVTAPAQVLGRVRAAWRGSKRVPLRGGWAGHAQASLLHAVHVALRPVADGIQPLYRLLVVSGAFRRLLPSRLRPRLVVFRSDKGVRRRFIVGNRAVGWEDHVTGQWRLRFPYALAIDPALLKQDAAKRRVSRGPVASFSTPGAEFKLVTQACASVFNPAQGDLLPELAPIVDWHKVLRLVSDHCVVALFFCGLRRHAWDCVPVKVQSQLRETTLANGAQNLRLCHELVPIYRSLEAEGIRAVPIKGPVLSVQAYGEPDLRVSWDIDILVDPRDASEARRILERQGYGFKLEVPAEFQRAHLREQGECTMVHSERRFEVELVLDVVPRYVSRPPDYERLWRTLGQVRLPGVDPLPCLAPEEHFLLCCRHAAKHRWERLLWVMDTAAFLRRRDGMDWTQVWRFATAAGECRSVLLAARLAEQLAGVAAPPQFVAGEEEHCRIAALADEMIFSLENESSGSGTRRAYLHFHLAIRERLRDRLRYLALLALMPSYADWMAIRLPRPLHPLYFLLRPFRLLAQARRVRR